MSTERQRTARGYVVSDHLGRWLTRDLPARSTAMYIWVADMRQAHVFTDRKEAKEAAWSYGGYVVALT